MYTFFESWMGEEGMGVIEELTVFWEPKFLKAQVRIIWLFAYWEFFTCIVVCYFFSKSSFF